MQRKDAVKKFALTRWHKINARTINGANPDWKTPSIAHYLNNGILIKFTREAFNIWCEENRAMILSIEAGGDIASVDRIDDNEHYTLSNMRVIPLTENIELGVKKRNVRRSHKLLKENPPKVCVSCGNLFGRRKRINGQMERYKEFKVRKTCNMNCYKTLRKREMCKKETFN